MIIHIPDIYLHLIKIIVLFMFTFLSIYNFFAWKNNLYDNANKYFFLSLAMLLLNIWSYITLFFLHLTGFLGLANAILIDLLFIIIISMFIYIIIKRSKLK